MHLRDASQQYDSFLRGKSAPAQALLEIEKVLSSRRWRYVLLGGAPRDILLHGAGATPRDLDVVVDVPKVDALASAFPSLGRNHFGGLQGELLGVLVDMWPLGDAWSLRDDAQPTFEKLVQTTTFNVEAIAFEPALDLKVMDAGCCACLESKILELVFEPVPFPALNLLRAAIFCRRYELVPGPRLRAFLAREQMPAKRLMKLMAQRYPRETMSLGDLEQFLA